MKLSLARLEDEKEQAHRAFLLFAMQAPKKRSQRCVSKAVSVSAPTIGDWKKRFMWEERIKEAGPAHDSIAQKTYNELYFKKMYLYLKTIMHRIYMKDYQIVLMRIIKK